MVQMSEHSRFWKFGLSVGRRRRKRVVQQQRTWTWGGTTTEDGDSDLVPASQRLERL